MELVAGLMGLAMLIWAIVLVRYHNVFLGSAIYLVAASVFPSEFAQIEVGGVSLTVDRAWLVVLAFQFGYDLWTGKAKPRAFTGSDIWLFLFLAWLVLRTIMTPIGEEMKGQPSTLMHLINGYFTPTFLFLLIRHSEIRSQTLWPAVVVILAFGIYLSLTAVLEITKQWSLLFPSFIGDPTQGIHFGRARGPLLQSVRLGMCLNFCLAILWVFPIWLYARERWAWLLAAGLTPLFLLAIWLTYTRSIWMGTGVIIVILLATLLRGKARTMALGSLAFSVAIGGVVVGPNLVSFKREYGEAETLESTRMRGAFAYVSMEMFKDRPLAGFGFNQFQVHNRPYLDDRTTNIRLESIRGYVHHNSYLSILVDLGLIGAILFLIASLSLIRNAWMLWRHPLSSQLAKSSAVLCFCMVAVHAIQMAFHEVSFSPIEYTILMMTLGLSQVFRDDLVEATLCSLGSSRDDRSLGVLTDYRCPCTNFPMGD